MSRYRRGGKNKQRQQDRPASVHRQQSSGRLSHWYNHKPVVTVDQLHKYRRKEFGTSNVAWQQRPPPISLSASPSFVTEYSCHFAPPYRTAEEMSSNRRHAAVPKDELQMDGDAEFRAEYAEQFKDGPRERNIVARQGSHIGPFVCADEAAPEGVGSRSEQNDQYVPHPDGRRADNLRPSTGLKMDEAPMDGETEQMANYRKYPTTPHPDAAVSDRNETPTTESNRSPTGRPLYDESMKEMILTRDSGMLIGPASSFTVIGGNRTERPGSVKAPSFRLEVVDCSGGCAVDDDRDGRTTDAFVVLKNFSPPVQSHGTTYSPAAIVGDVGHHVRVGSSGGNRWVKRRQRKMGTVRFIDDRRVRLPVANTGKTIQ